MTIYEERQIRKFIRDWRAKISHGSPANPLRIAIEEAMTDLEKLLYKLDQ